MDSSKDSQDLTTAFKFLQEVEGCRLEAYQPVPGDKWTIGYGHTTGVKKGDEITHEKALEYLKKDMEFVAEAVEDMVQIELSDNQRAAIISLVFNVGAMSFFKSRALMALNMGDFANFKHEAFSVERGWVNFQSRPLQGLINRRQLELDLFESSSPYYT